MRHALVRAVLSHFAEQAGYTGSVGLTLDRRRYEAEAKQRREPVLDADEDNDYGITLVGQKPFVWINPQTNRTLSRLARTCAHEAVHMALPDFPHGKAFDARVRRLLRGGRL